MLKKILIGLGIVIVLVVAGLLYLNNQNRTLSPPGSVTLETKNLVVTINYSRPSVRDRLIFGEEEEGALLPYGMYWRLGANEPTDIEVSGDFLFGDKEIPAGKYVIYAIPRKGEMELRLSEDLRFWGYTEPNYDMDLATTFVRLETIPKTEQFTIDLDKKGRTVMATFKWDVYQWSLPIEPSR